MYTLLKASSKYEVVCTFASLKLIIAYDRKDMYFVLRKMLTGVCGPDFRNHTLGYGDRGPKSYPWLRTMGQNQTLDNRKCH